MPWFYYSGSCPRSIPVKKGLSVAVRPYSKIEIIDTGNKEVQVLRRKGKLRPTGRPAGTRSITETELDSRTTEEVTSKSVLAQKIAEKGVTQSKDKAPKSKKPEYTEGELASSKDKSDSGGKKSKGGHKKSHKSKNVEEVEVLSKEVAGSPNGEGASEVGKDRRD